jgi:acetylxylan esterase
MILRTFALAALRAAAVLAVCTKLQDCPQFESLKTSDCQPFHHFLARGSTSPYPGHVIETVGKVCAALNSEGSPNACGYEDITYWAMNGGDRWCKSAHEGALNGAAQMRNYTQRCPDSHLILMGFSQGGSVALDVLGGGGGELWGCNQADNPKMDRTTAPGSKIAAALAFGPTRRSANQSYTVGGGEISDGSAPRSSQELAGLKPYADAGILREYCQPGDPICAPHSDNKDMSKHLDYFTKFGDEAADWVIDLARKAAKKQSDDKSSSASDLLKQGITHPVANFMVGAIVLVGLL